MKISPKKLQFIKNHARQDFPREAVGALLGNTNSVLMAVKLNNTSVDPDIAYTIENLDYDRLEAIYGHPVVGFYHSHPIGNEFASKKDQEFFFPNLFYVIYSIETDKFSFNRKTNLLLEIQEQ